MRNRAVKQGFVLAATLVLLFPGALALTGCNSTPGGTGSGNQTPGANWTEGMPAPTPAGTQYLGGQIQLVKIKNPSAADPNATIAVKNLSGKPLAGLVAKILMYSPPTGGIQEYESEVAEQRFDIFRDETVELKARSSRPDAVKSVQVRIEAGLTIAREGGVPGSRFLDGKLECVGLVNLLTAFEPSVTVTLQNISGKSLDLLEYQMSFFKGATELDKTIWLPVPGPIPPDGTVVLKPDVSAFDLGAVGVVIKVQESVL